MADGVFKTLFADSIITDVTFTGAYVENPKRAFEKSNLYALVTTFGDAWCTANNGDRGEIKRVFQRAFRKAYNRMNRKRCISPRRPRNHGDLNRQHYLQGVTMRLDYGLHQ
ncbi:unnamed protein product [Dibothriocephalus latus]|uniref:Uncharacterized protein n=1 Tax=Dibothriocephalus latus TaxID=60516 RepID=A0A3P6R8I3_DIBLA|nr:unnamed protein product [Dibothriocephalus latus]